jgi:hypothetical protein
MKSRATKKTSDRPSAFGPQLQFDGITPVAPHGLGGLVRDHFGNSRLNAIVAHHGGISEVNYFGTQHRSAPPFFRGAYETAWNKCFRFYAAVDGRRYYPELNDTKLYPFGLSSHCQLESAGIDYDLLLLPDALVQRIHVAKNPRRLKVAVGILHQEAVCAVGGDKRTWSDFVFDLKLNALITSCTDFNPTPPTQRPEDSSLSQRGLGAVVDAPKAVTWIGLGCDHRITTHRGYHHRSKHYVLSTPLKGEDAAFFVVFATSRTSLVKRLKQLSKTVHRECDQLIGGYLNRLLKRPQIDVGDSVLNSAFGQYPEMIQSMKVLDRPGATRGSMTGYWVWGWDGMTPLVPMALANEPEYTASILRFFQETRDPTFGLPMNFATNFRLGLKAPFPAQLQYVCGLYHYVATTGDLAPAREFFPTCKYLLDRCREKRVKDTGLVSSCALWPDFPEAMGEDGNDVSSLNNSFLYQGLRSMEYLAAAIGKPKLAKECGDWARQLRKSFVKYLYDEKHGTFISSCSSLDLKPRKHYCAQAVFWVTPFARELVSHAPDRIAAFMNKHLRSEKCLLTLPHWDTAWMADGNQLGSSYPIADYFYVNVHKLLGDDRGLETWLGDVKWFWERHTAPEAFTPEADNEDKFGADNTGGKQAQSVSCWYACLYNGLAGLDFDHEGLTLTPWGHRPIDIRNLRLHGVSIDLKIRGNGNHIGSLKLNGKPLLAGSRKIAWKTLQGKTARIELLRSDKAPKQSVIVRADGLCVTVLESKPGLLSARVSGEMSGEVVIQAIASAQILVNGKPEKYPYNAATKTFAIPFSNEGDLKLKILQ